MSLSTVFTFLSKAFAKISIAFSLFFVVLAASYYFGIISETVFTILFTGIIIMIFIDSIITFVLAKHKAIYLHGLEKTDITDNYAEYKEEQKKKKKAEPQSGEGLVKDIALGIGTRVVNVIKPAKETDEEKIEKLKKKLLELEQ